MDFANIRRAFGTLTSLSSNAVAGAMAHQTLENIRKGCADAGAKYAGKVGQYVGSHIIGKALAGSTVQALQDNKNSIAESIRVVGATVAAQEVAKGSGEQQSWMSTLGKVALASGKIGLGAAAALNLAPLGIGVTSLAFANIAINSLPKMFAAAYEEVKPGESVSLVHDVLMPTLTVVAIDGASKMVANITRYNVIESAYKANVKLFQEVGAGVASYLPKSFTSYVTATAQMLGEASGPSVAMSDAVIAQANQAADLAQGVTVVGLQMANSAMNQKQPRGWMDTAKTVAILAGAAGLAIACPEAATLVCGTAMLTGADKAIRWLKTQISAPAAQPQVPAQAPASAIVKEASVQRLEVVVNTKSEVIAATAA